MTDLVRRLLVLALAGLPLMAACGGDGSTLGPDGTPKIEEGDEVDTGQGEERDDGMSPAMTLDQLSEEIFTPKCAVPGCHTGGFPTGSMSLDADRIAAEIIDVPSAQQPSLKRIDPGNPDDSYLIRKVRGTGAGSQMPLGRAPLSAGEIQRIVDWVTAGAPVE